LILLEAFSYNKGQGDKGRNRNNANNTKEM
jgi:hypothetical protein